MNFKFSRESILLVLSLLTVTILSINHLFNIGLIINDDIQAQLKVRSLGFYEYIKSSFEVWMNQGRPNFLANIWYYIPFAMDNFLYYKMISILSILLNLFLVSIILKIAFTSKRVFFISFLLGVIGLQNSWEHTPITTFSGFFSISLSILLISIVTIQLYLQKRKKIYLYISVFSYILILFTYEVFIAYILVFIVLAFLHTKNLKQTINVIKWHILLSLAYFMIFIILNLTKTEVYDGAAVNDSVNILNIMGVIWQFSIASLPTYFLFNEKYQYLFYIYSDLYSKELSIFNLIKSIKVEWIIKGVMVFVLFTITALKLQVKINIQKVFIALGMLLTLFFLPSLPLALTKQYQDAVLINNQLGMPITYFSYLTLIFISTISIILLVKIPYPKEIFRKIVVVLMGLILTGISIGVDFNNHYISTEQERLAYKWQVIDRFIETETFNNIPTGSYIYSPNLNNTVGSLGIHDGYWEQYIEEKINYEKDLILVSDIDYIPLEVENIYYLSYIQNNMSNNQYLIISQTTRSQQFKVSNYVEVYNYTNHDNFMLYGLQKDTTDLMVSNIKIPLNRDYFKFALTQNNYSLENELKKISLTGEDIVLESLGIEYNYHDFYNIQ